MPHESQIVIGPDGTVLAATGELPLGLVDARLEECEGLSREIRDAGKALVEQLRRRGQRVLTHTIADKGDGRSVQLVAIEALAIRRTATDLRTLLTSKLVVLSSQAESVNMSLGIEIADDVPAAVYLDAEKVAWAVTTLVGNALRYVQSASRRMHSGKIAVRATFDGRSQVTIEVQDDGPGIPADTVTRLFKRDGLNVRGSGLALLLISDICVAHGGEATVRSSIAASEHGTAVRLTLPIG